jgi:hypothetical protein
MSMLRGSYEMSLHSWCESRFGVKCLDLPALRRMPASFYFALLSPTFNSFLLTVPAVPHSMDDWFVCIGCILCRLLLRFVLMVCCCCCTLDFGVIKDGTVV